ncbi:flagellar brake protein [Sediminibacillus massiliensis]|uniref:flagellar brake protein n=1 Tax=Sediminibacillus massiliensis TaxID=1926277 RepID=UPI000988700D|nr:flagellar brake domain-containing protein [Sediminibacillus massiliensis]
MIKIGSRLVLETGKGENSDRYRCKIVDVIGNLLYVDYPVHELTGRTSLFRNNTKFSANFVGTDRGVYRFSTEIKEKKKMNNVPTLVLDYPGDEHLQRIQRRQYVRMEVTLDVSVHDPNGILAPFTAVTQDISGGGISLLFPEHYDEISHGTSLDLWLVLPMENSRYEYIRTSAKAIRTITRKEGQSKLLSLKFGDMNEKDRQSIIRFCFQKQLQSRKRGMGL